MQEFASDEESASPEFPSLGDILKEDSRVDDSRVEGDEGDESYAPWADEARACSPPRRTGGFGDLTLPDIPDDDKGIEETSGHATREQIMKVASPQRRQRRAAAETAREEPTFPHIAPSECEPGASSSSVLGPVNRPADVAERVAQTTTQSDIFAQLGNSPGIGRDQLSDFLATSPDDSSEFDHLDGILDESPPPEPPFLSVVALFQ